jgi:hypothetical protein
MDGGEWVFVGPGECDLCQSMVGTVSSGPIGSLHPNCGCSSEPICGENTWDVSGDSSRYGPDGECFVFNAEITVTCWDGTEIGQSVSIDMGCASYGDFEAAIWDAAAPYAEELAEGCPDCEPNVS